MQFCIYEGAMSHIGIHARVSTEDGQNSAARVRACRAYAQARTRVAGVGFQLGTGRPQNG